MAKKLKSPEKAKKTIKKPTDEPVTLLKKPTSIKDRCKINEKKSKSLALTFMFIFLGISAISVSIFALTPSAIVVVQIDPRDIDFAPDRAIYLDDDGGGTYAHPSNATFTPLWFLVGILYPPMEAIVATERGLGMWVKGNFVEGTIEDSRHDAYQNQQYQGFGFYSQVIDQSKINSISLRLSADYTVLVQILVGVSFGSGDIYTLSFTYIFGHDYGNEEQVGSQTTFATKRMYTTLFDIEGIVYDYPLIEKFHTEWEYEAQIVGYPFILNGTHSTYFDWGLYTGVQQWQN